MFVRNTTKKKIRLPAFEGYEFSALSGVSAIWDKAGEFWVDKLAPSGEHGKWKGNVFTPQAAPLPALVAATKEEWEKEGKKLVEVGRYQIQRGLIPRTKLIEIAQERGVKLSQTHTNMDDDEILEMINSLPVSDEIAYPEIEQNVQK